MVKIEIDEIYRKLGNLFRLALKSQGKVYRVPPDYKLTEGQLGLTIYDKATGGKLSCSNFDNEWDEVVYEPLILKSFISKQFSLKLRSIGYRTSREKAKFQSAYVAYLPKKEILTGDEDIFRIFDGFEYRICHINDFLYLCINPHLKIKTQASIKELLQKGLQVQDIISLRVTYLDNQGKWRRGFVAEVHPDKCKIRNIDTWEDDEVGGDSVYPLGKPEILQLFLNKLYRRSNIVEIQRKYSFLEPRRKQPAKARFAKTIDIASALAEQVFPLIFGDFEIIFVPKSISLRL